MCKFFVVAFFAFLTQSTCGRYVVDQANSVSDTPHFTNEEIVTAIRFLETLPNTTDADEMKIKLTDLCAVMNKNLTRPEDLERLEILPKDPRLDGHKTQMWGSESTPHPITNFNIVALKRLCADIVKYMPK